MGVRQFLANSNNLAAVATLTPSDVKDISGSVLLRSVDRDGFGDADLTGSYTGADDALFEIEITDILTTDEALISTPVRTGQGTGTIGSIATVGLSAQSFTVELIDLGDRLLAAELDLGGNVFLTVRTAGAAGNSWTLSVDRSGLTFTDTGFSLLEELPAGTESITGAQYDWSTVAASQEGIVPTTAKRLVFGVDTTVVYVQWKQYDYDTGEWAYHFDPPIQRAIPAGTLIRFVTGTYAVTLSDTVNTENYTNLVTRYDLLSAIKAGSSYIDVSGVIANNRKKGGQALRDLRLNTSAHNYPSSGEGSDAAKGFTNIAVGANADTELLTAVCWAAGPNDHPNAWTGHELWRLEGSVSGALVEQLVTGTDYTHPEGKFGLRIPSKLNENFGGQGGEIKPTLGLIARAEGDPDIKVCAQAILGANAKDGEYVFTFKRRPDNTCGECEDAATTGRFSEECLGIQVPGEDGDDVALDAAYQTRLESLYSWRSTFMANNTALGAADAIIKAAFHDLELADKITDAFASALADGSYTVAAANTEWDAAFTAMQSDVSQLSALGAVTAWQPGTAYAEGAIVVPPSHHYNGYKYEAFFIAQDSACSGSHTPPATITSGEAPGPNFNSAETIGDSIFDNGDILIVACATSGNMEYTLKWRNIGPADEKDVIYTSESGSIRKSVDQFVRRYLARMDYVRSLAGIVPKDEAGLEGSQCWQDEGDAYWWESEDGFLPAFTNVYYHTAKEVWDTAEQKHITIDAKEFGFIIKTACPENLKEGDSLTIEINGAATAATYQVGDKLRVAFQAAANLPFVGGQDGDNTQTWSVIGSVDGPFANYSFDPDSPTAYNNGGLSFQLAKGGIAHAEGDKFTFTIVGGHYQWRKDSGAWNTGAIISATPTVLSDGLSVEWTTGENPSFVTGDTWAWDVLQPYAANHLQTPGVERWAWDGTGANIVIDLGSDQAITALAIAFHTLPSGASVTWEGGTSPGVYPDSQAGTWRAGAMVETVDWTARYIRLTVASATGGAIGWVWIGTPLQPELSGNLRIRHDWRMARGEGDNSPGSYLGKRIGGTLEYELGELTSTEYDSMIALLDAAKQASDQYFLLLPHLLRPAQAYLVRQSGDNLEVQDYLDFEADDDAYRRVGLTLELEGYAA